MDDDTDIMRGDSDDDKMDTSSSAESVASDRSFELVQILAERGHPEIPKFLIEWKNYDLLDATWEPREHLHPDTLRDWEAFKKRTGRRTVEGFRVSTWKEAIRAADREKRLHHERDNIRRTLAGKRPRDYKWQAADALEEGENCLEDFEDSDDESLFVRSPNPAEDDQLFNPGSPLFSEDSDSGKTPVKASAPLDLDADALTESSLADDSPRPMTALNSRQPRLPSASVSSVAQRASSNKPLGSGPTAKPTPKRGLPPVSATTSAAQRRMSHGSGINIFIGGKQRKHRPTLLDAVSDASRGPKLLRLRHQNLVQKNLRDREGVIAPAISRSRLIPLAESSTGFGLTPMNEPSVGHQISEVEIIDNPDKTEVSVGPKRSNLRGPEAVKKRKHTVHWDENIQVHEVPRLSQQPNEVGQDDFDQGSVLQGRKASILHDMEALEGAQLRKRKNRSMTLSCQLGTEETQSISMTFHDLPEDEADQWVQHFERLNPIVFTHTCTTQDWNSRPDLIDERLCQGYVSALEDAANLEMVADWLDVGCSCLMHYSQDYSILLFLPSDVAEPNYEQAQASSDSGAYVLKYSIIKPSAKFDPDMLAPLSIAAPPKGLDIITVTSGLPVFDVVFGLRLDQLLPSKNRKRSRPSVFLAFPPSARQEACFVSQWFRYWQADCDIKSSLSPGEWLSFVKLDYGTVIIHQDAAWTIRLFPGFAELLRRANTDFTFFLFNRAFSKPFLQSFTNFGPGGNELCPVFRWSDAFLLTPSFFVSQPEQAYNLIKWLWKSYQSNTSIYHQKKLVVCAAVSSWTLELALEKKRKLESMTNSERIYAGLTDQAVESAFKTCKLVGAFMGLADDDCSPLVLAPEAIVGDDEQSLVNWFGWWTIKNMDKVRKSHVVGSDHHHSARLSKLVSASDCVLARPKGFDDKGQDQEPRSLRNEAWKLVANDDAVALRRYLMNVEEGIKRQPFRPMLLFRYAVAYWNPDMTFHFQDYNGLFSTYRQWIKILTEYLSPSQCKHINTIGGFFYTIDGEWDPAQYPQDTKHRRRPWIAICRLMNPHAFPRKNSELLIWDVAAWSKHPGNANVYEDELICAQKELVKAVREASHVPLRLPLERVWLGGSIADHGGEGFSQPLDVTLNWLEKLSQNIKQLLPAPTDKLPDRGWKRVWPGKPPEAVPGSVPSTLSAVREANPLVADLEPAVSSGTTPKIFHPPGADGPRPRCRNRLYDWAEGQRRRGSSGKTEFVFEPTMKWYNDQVQNGKGLHHIDFSGWRSIFHGHNIPDPEATTNTAAKDRR
ncbi:hypothetical protein L249_0001 [Ophiocordyceps polyrhachis-furcata BCC 54312]|uniref:Chromo domain-containing protein n=1 Tax=Ophiocordyceps polyrhachis-furcata BCC 54312 TaxID=1330021 RepID=A0A367LDG0_9HYPO|nr:hypothetical protein L249_0001 [Ophiocordyceps polyrhachis-furcata BCC 54312]